MSRGQVSFGSIDLNAGAQSSADAKPVGGSGEPFRILILADLSGRENCQKNDAKSLASRPLTLVDRDNFDDVLERFQPQLDRTLLTGEGEQVTIQFQELDDFHPDELFNKLAIFESLRRMRRQLMNPNLCQQAIDEIESWQTGDITLEDDDSTAPISSGDSGAGQDSDRVTVDQLFDAVLDESGETANVETQWQQIVSDLVSPYREKPVNPDRDKYVELVDGAIERAMRSLLHHPHFAELEAAWRSIYQMVRKVETSSKLSIHVCDISKSEIRDDIASAENLADTALYEKLVRSTVGTPGGKPWNIVVGFYSFNAAEESVSLLGRFAKIVASGNGYLFTNASSTARSWCDPEAELPESWQQLMAVDGSTRLSVFWPPYLVRLPYGKKTSPTEAFDFEEVAEKPGPNDLLWAGSAMLAATSLAERFSNQGWGVDPTDVTQFTDMPMYLIEVDGEKEMHPCGQFLLTDEQLGRLVEAGITPLVSYRAQNQVAFQGMQTVARKPVRFGS